MKFCSGNPLNVFTLFWLDPRDAEQLIHVSQLSRVKICMDWTSWIWKIGGKPDICHQTFQVPKMEVLSLIRLFWGWVFPYIRLTYCLYRWGFLHFRYLKCLVNLPRVPLTIKYTLVQLVKSFTSFFWVKADKSTWRVSGTEPADGRKGTWYVYTAFIKLKQGQFFCTFENTIIPKVCSKKPMGWSHSKQIRTKRIV